MRLAQASYERHSDWHSLLQVMLRLLGFLSIAPAICLPLAAIT
jgi:hypothetical protein